MKIVEMFDLPDHRVIYYFAYGMLTDPEMMEGIELMGRGTLKNYNLELCGFANLIPQSGSSVQGCLWAIDSEILHHLDQIEGYPDLYIRKTVRVTVDGEQYPAQVYLMTMSTRDRLLNQRPMNNYVQQIVNGYRHAGIPLEQLAQALKKFMPNKRKRSS